MPATESIRIGTSGWHYRHWEGPFYPPHLSPRRFLPYYSRSFSTVEVNYSFYRLPERVTLSLWKRQVPPSFIFSVKASRYITEAKKLKDPGQGLSRLFGRIEILGDTLGPVLFQLPPRWKADTGRLASFLSVLPRGMRYAFEFREPSWFTTGVYELLAQRGAALCFSDYGGMLSPREVTSDFVYVRLHGPGSYGDRALRQWAAAFCSWRQRKKEIFCYFNNDAAGYAAHDALRLQALVDVSVARR